MATRILLNVTEPLGSPDPISPNLGAFRDGTTNAVTCEICGTRHPERSENGDSYYTGHFLGNLVVAQCCGKIFEIAYRENGEAFASAFLEDFSAKPSAPRFGTFIYVLKDRIKKAASNLFNATRDVVLISEDLSKMN